MEETSNETALVPHPSPARISGTECRDWGKMIPEDSLTNRSPREWGGPIDQSWFLGNRIQCPGLTPGAPEIRELADRLPKSLAVFHYKQQMPCLWIVFVGGTGTGKSTVFNAFAGARISDTGVERPKTFGPIVYAHRDLSLEKAFPFPATQIERQARDDADTRPATGTPGKLMIVEHNREDLSHLVLADTPDLDSVEAGNREIAEDLYLLADAVVFIASQEKYADEVPYQFFLRILEDKIPYFFLLNKADEQLTGEEVIGVLQSQGITFSKDHVWLVSYASSDPFRSVSEDTAFRDFMQTISEQMSAERSKDLLETQHARRSHSLKTQTAILLDLLQKEDSAADIWLDQLDLLYQETSRDLIKQQRTRFTAESREYLQAEIRRLFAKYDILAKPRRFIREFLWMPLRLLGLGEKVTRKAHKDALEEVRKKIDFTPVQTAVGKFNRLVLERLSPSDEASLLFKRLRQADVVLKEEEIRERIWKEKDQLDEWLEATFRKLSRGIPTHKKLGIYSTSVVWGVLILSFEIVVGGGFTVVDAVLDSALAPFITKGAVELFAYREIQKVARKLAKRYQEGLVSVVRDQRDQYERCLRSLLTPEETMRSLKALVSTLDKRWTPAAEAAS